MSEWRLPFYQSHLFHNTSNIFSRLRMLIAFYALDLKDHEGCFFLQGFHSSKIRSKEDSLKTLAHLP
jgi:hypothetical protein